MISIEHLSKSYDNAVGVLDDVSLTIPKGSIYGLIGKSGAGKSTLLRCINGLEQFQKGTIVVDGIDVRSLRSRDLREFRSRIGMIFQQFSLLERMTALENVALPMKCWKYSRTEIHEKARELLALVGLSEKENAKTRELSGGQKQRVAIARALCMDPMLLLCDEATSALDPKTAEDILILLDSINRKLGLTIVVVTHQMDVLKSACDHMSIIEQGKVAATGPVKQIFIDRPPALQNLLGEKENYVTVPEGSVLLTITLPEEHESMPLITSMARSLAIDFHVVETEVDHLRNGRVSYFSLRLRADDAPAVQQYLDERYIHHTIRGERNGR